MSEQVKFSHYIHAMISAYGEYAPFMLRNPAVTEVELFRMIRDNPDDPRLFPHRFHECSGLPDLTDFGSAVKEQE